MKANVGRSAASRGPHALQEVPIYDVARSAILNTTVGSQQVLECHPQPSPTTLSHDDALPQSCCESFSQYARHGAHTEYIPDTLLRAGGAHDV